MGCGQMRCLRLPLLICIGFAEVFRTCVIQQSSLPIAVAGNTREPGIWEPRVSCCTVTIQPVVRAQQRECCPLGRTPLKSDLGCPHKCCVYSRALKRGVFTAKAAKDVLDLLRMTMGTVMFHVKQACLKGYRLAFARVFWVPRRGYVRPIDACRRHARRSGRLHKVGDCVPCRRHAPRSERPHQEAVRRPSDGMA
jgi:hypothetical protein